MNANKIVIAEYTELTTAMRTKALQYAVTEHPQATPMLLMRGASAIESLMADNTRLLDELERCTSGNGTYISLEAHKRLLAASQHEEPSAIPCCICGGEVVEFTVPNDIWNLVMRPDDKETDREYLCLDCWYVALRDFLSASQRRERAAVAALQDICKNCGWDNKPCTNTNCANYAWHGPQEAGKGSEI